MNGLLKGKHGTKIDKNKKGMYSWELGFFIQKTIRFEGSCATGMRCGSCLEELTVFFIFIEQNIRPVLLILAAKRDGCTKAFKYANIV